MDSKFTFGTPANNAANTSALSLSALATPKPANTTFSFGTPTPAQQSASTNSSTAGAPSFGFGTNSSTTTNAPSAAKPSFSFGTPSTNAQPSNFSFGSKPPASGDTKASVEVPKASAFSFDTKQSAPSIAKPENPASGGFSFGSSKPSENSSNVPAQSSEMTKTSTSSAFSFNNTPAKPSVPTNDAFKQANNASSINSDNKTTQPDNPSTALTTTNKALEVKSVQQADVSTQLRGKSMQDLITTWTTSLQQSMQLFHSKAAQIALLDTQLLDQADKIYQLVLESKEISREQAGLIRTLDYIESQQTQLDNELDMFEEKLKGLVQQNEGSSAMDIREQTFELAQNLSAELDHFGAQLKEIMQFINQSNVSNNDETMDLINRILNEHFNSLKWIDSASNVLAQKLKYLKSSISSS